MSDRLGRSVCFTGGEDALLGSSSHRWKKRPSQPYRSRAETVWPLSSDSLRFYGVIQYFKETHTRIIDRKNSTVLLSFRNKNLNLEQYFLIVDYFVVVSNLDSLTVLKNCQHGAIQPTSLPEKIRFLAIIIHFKYKMLQLIE